MRVLVPTVYEPGCPTVRSRLLPLCMKLAENGINFTFLVRGNGVNDVYPCIRYIGYRNYFELVKLIISVKKKDYDLILACKPYSICGGVSFIVARLKSIGYVLDVDDRTFPSEINKWWRVPLYIQEWLVERMLMLLKPATTVASRGLKEYWGQHSEYIPNSADLHFFSRKRWSSKIFRERYGISGRVVIWPAVFFQEVDRSYAIEIFREVYSIAPDITLVVIGDGEYLGEVKTKASSMGLKNILFLGAVPHEEMPNYYASADAGLLPLRNNHYDACKGPIKLFEYMAMELPVIATDVGEPREMINKSNCGILIPFNSPEKAALMIAELFKSNEMMAELGHNGRSYLENYQSIEMLSERFSSIFYRTLGKTCVR